MDIEIPDPALTVTSFPNLVVDGEWVAQIELWGEVVYEKSIPEPSGYAWPVVEGEIKRQFARRLRSLLEDK